MSDYSIGIDFGTNSCRALMVDCATGEEIACTSVEYSNGVMVNNFINGMPLTGEWALGYPLDYTEVVCEAVSELVKKTGIKRVAGLGFAFSSCCVMPVRADGTPLCFLPEFRYEPHAYIKVTRHKRAVAQAKKIAWLAHEMNEPWLDLGKNEASPEWILPKILETLEEAPEVYNKADYFTEAVDWLVWQMTGEACYNSFSAAFKAQINGASRPSREFLKALDPRLENLYDTKLNLKIKSPCECAGRLTKTMCERMGLDYGTAVAVGAVDIPVCVPALKAVREGCLTAILGKMASLITLSSKAVTPTAIARGEKGSVAPDFYTYKSGQPCVGDNYAWFLNNLVPPEYHVGAKEQGRNLHSYTAQKMMALKAGENGILALNWLKGNNVPLHNKELSGVFVGIDTDTKVEHLYRAIVEGMAFDTRLIVDTYRQAGIDITDFYGVGTIAERNPFIMQVYADILNMPVRVAGTEKSSALGAAVYGALAGGIYKDIVTASEAMGCVKDITYTPDNSSVKIYDRMYTQYKRLVDFFAADGKGIMAELKNIKSI